jgi:hypothetical protein
MSKPFNGGDTDPSSSWTQDPPSERCSHTVSYQAEIVSATGFDGRELFVRYEIVCPAQWDLRTGNTGDGVVSEDSGSEKSLSELEEEQDLLCGTTQRARAIEKPFAAHCRTGYGSGAPLSTDLWLFYGATEGSFWGLLYFVITCISVVVGYDYAFWIVPALVIPIVLGSGNPGGGEQEVVYMSAEDELDEAWGGNYGVSHYGQAPRLSMPSSGGIAEPTAIFNHQLSLSFDVKDLTYDSAVAPSGAYPVLLVEVFSEGMFGSNSLEGYGYLPLKSSPGSVDASITTWKPIGCRVSKMNDAFVGSAPELRNSIFAEVPNKTASSLSRFGVLSEGSGRVRIKIHTSVTDPRVAEAMMALRLKDAELLGTGRRADSSRRTVDDILQQMKVAGALSRTAGPSSNMGLASSDSRTRIQHRPDREARVMDILRRAKDRLGEHATQRSEEKEVGTFREAQSSKPSEQGRVRSTEGAFAEDKVSFESRGREEPDSAAVEGDADADATVPLLDPAAARENN